MKAALIPGGAWFTFALLAFGGSATGAAREVSEARCSLAAFARSRDSATTYVPATARGDTVLTDAAVRILSATGVLLSNGQRTYGQRMVADTFDGFGVVRLRAAFAASGSREIVVVPWSYRSDCVPYRWGGSARFATPNERGRIAGGIQMLNPLMFLEFSEIIGNGTQEMAPPATNFAGAWRGRGVRIDLRQEGALVTGCYDTGGRLNGTVTGNLLRATGADEASGVPSAFILNVRQNGELQGVRSTNGAPFQIYAGAAAPPGTAAVCPPPPPPSLGCGSVIHGIQFGFDSAELLPASEPVLAELFRGLRGNTAASIMVEGHTSSEGAEAYNQALSERRARAVADDLIRRGLDAARLRAVGVGEVRPIAGNSDESGRSLNRRVEVHCSTAG